MENAFLTAEWEHLVMANYIVDPTILKPYLPIKTEIDLYNNECYVSLVGFMFNKTKIKGIYIPFHKNFEEVNLRFYVRYKENGKWSRGVVFIKEIVPKAAITLVANTLYHEKYCTMPMKHTLSEEVNNLKVSYHWKFNNIWNSIVVNAQPLLQPIKTGSEAEFILEHYKGYSKYNPQTTYEYSVEHPRWDVYPVKDYEINCDFEGLYGTAFSFMQQLTPHSIFLAKGSPIKVLGKRKL